MFKRLLIPLDGSATSDRALAAAIELAQTCGARVRLVHVGTEMTSLAGYDPYGAYSGELIRAMREAGETIVQHGMRIATDGGVQADCMVIEKLGERLGETVARAAKLWGTDLIVVGTHGRRGVGRVLMGSGAEQIIRLAPTPVLVVRAGDGPG